MKHTPNNSPADADIIADFHAWYDAKNPEGADNDETELPQDASKPASAPQASKTENIGNQPETETNEVRIARLEKEIEKERKAFNENRERKEKFNAAAWKSFEEKVAEVTDLKKRVKREAEIKAKCRKQFLADSFASPSDFEFLWQSKLRNEAMIAEVTEKQARAREAAKHSIYQKW
jgi:hypothetical protein